jgi:hypothetical protein
VSDRTWDDNRETINDLWPLLELRPAEKELWHDDLSALDQETLYEALREVKRSKESPWPQLAWIHEAYRQLRSAQRSAERIAERMQPAFSGERLVIDVEESERLNAHYRGAFEAVQTLEELDALAFELNASVDKLEARTAIRLFREASGARERIHDRLRVETLNQLHGLGVAK